MRLFRLLYYTIWIALSSILQLSPSLANVPVLQASSVLQPSLNLATNPDPYVYVLQLFTALQVPPSPANVPSPATFPQVLQPSPTCM